MQERDAKKYEEECEKLKEEVLRRRAKVIEKHKNDPKIQGMGITPEFRELGEVSKYFAKEFKKIKKRYDIKQDDFKLQ